MTSSAGESRSARPAVQEEKVALITGAARGIGRATALRLAQDGAAIVAVDRGDQSELVAELTAQGARVHACSADVGELAQLQAAVAEGVEAFGRLDVVCANAGVFEGLAPTWELDEEVFQRVIDINLVGAWRTLKATVPAIIAGGRGGSIVLVNSVGGIRGVGWTAAYTASKHGVIGLMRTLVNEVSIHDIRVNTVHPTTVDTEMIQNDTVYRTFLPHIPKPTREDFAAAFAEHNALDVPWVQPRDVADAIAWLASDEARYVTGVQLPVDAGYLEKG